MSVHLSILISVHSSVQLFIHVLTVLAQPSHPALCWAHPPPLGDPLFFKEGRHPGQKQVASQVGLQHRADIWKEWPHAAL